MSWKWNINHYLCFVVVLVQRLPAPTTSYVLIRSNQKQGYGERSVVDLAEKIAERTAHKLKYILQDYKVVSSDKEPGRSDDKYNSESAESATPYKAPVSAYVESNEEVKHDPPIRSDEDRQSYTEDQMKDADPVPDNTRYSEENDGGDNRDEKEDLRLFNTDRLMINGKYYDRSKDDTATVKRRRQNGLDRIRVVRVHSQDKLTDSQKAKVVSKLMDQDITRNKNS